MRKLVLMALSLAVVSSGIAKEVNEESVENYMRSSLYTIILNSEKQNNYFEEETKKGENANEFMSLAKDLANTDAKKAANDTTTGSIFSLPAKIFASIPIPNQFNEHNLGTRVIDFDILSANLTENDKEAAAKDGFQGKKKSKFNVGNIAKSTAGISTEGSEINASFDEVAPAVMHRYFKDNNVAELVVARWYDYAPDASDHWGLGTVMDRGTYNFSDVDLQNAANDPAVRTKIDQTAFDMIGNTFIMVTNLRFRSYQAIVAESQGAVTAIGGSKLGGLASLAGAAASAAAGDGYTVQAVSSLYHLVWNEDINQRFAVDIVEKNATLEDLIEAGFCKLEYLGTEKSSSNIRQSLFSEKPISDLVQRATARAIDEAIIKLQNNHEQFRTALPIIGGDGNGTIYARIGTKEGLNEKDEYEILEKQEDSKGHTFYKSVGTVKPIKGKIWNNAFGASEELAENPKATDADREAVNRGYSEFKGKKGDFKGYYLRLKKKK